MYRGRTLHVKEMYRRQRAVCKLEITLMDITSHCLFAGQLTRTFEVFVLSNGIYVYLQ